MSYSITSTSSLNLHDLADRGGVPLGDSVVDCSEESMECAFLRMVGPVTLYGRGLCGSSREADFLMYLDSQNPFSYFLTTWGFTYSSPTCSSFLMTLTNLRRLCVPGLGEFLGDAAGDALGLFFLMLFSEMLRMSLARNERLCC